MTREEILAIYNSGPEAVIALVERLLARIAEQDRRIEEQEKTIAALTARVKELEDRLAKNSTNSNKPPSTDGFERKTRSQRSSSGKKPGGQKGHPGDTLRMVEQPDRVVQHSPIQCQGCGTSLENVASRRCERRQVFDLPPLKLEVTEHQAEVKQCPNCRQINKGEFPPEVTTSVQYGERIKALAVYLIAYQLLPYERASEFFEDLFASTICEGTLQAAVQVCSNHLESVEVTIKECLRQASVVNCDETGMYINSKCHWLHVVSTEKLTHYACHPKRGKAATEAIEILPQFHGTAVHDGWQSYGQYENCGHALCNAHHLRELTFLEEQEKQPWARAMKDLLGKIKNQVDNQREAGMNCLDEETLRGFEQEYQQILAQGLEANPPPEPPPPGTQRPRGRRKQSKAKNLLDRMKAMREVLAFMYDFRVPFDNNLAERDLRMMKVQQKISGCFRSTNGADYFCRLRSYISTLRKHGEKVLPSIEQAFLGNPFLPPPAQA